MKNLTDFKEKILADYRRQLFGFPHDKELVTQCNESILLQTVDKSIIWFIENYEAITPKEKNAATSQKPIKAN